MYISTTDKGYEKYIIACQCYKSRLHIEEVLVGDLRNNEVSYFSYEK
jgi:hypothetical protein